MKSIISAQRKTKLLSKKTGMLLLALTMAFPVLAQENRSKPRTITVTGTAEKELVPDEIYVQVDLREYDKKNGTKIDIESIRNNFLNACKTMGLTESDISVQGYSGWDGNYWLYQKTKKKNPDMKAAISYWVKLSSTGKMDELVKKLDDEATQNFFIAKTAYSKEHELKNQLKMEALKSAKQKAINYAAAIEEQIGKALVVNEPVEVNLYPQPRYFANTMTKSSAGQEIAAPPMNVDFKKIKYEYQAVVVYELK